MTYLWLRRRGLNPGAAGLGGWIPISLNDGALALISLGGLLVLMLLTKFSRLLIRSLTVPVLILASGIFVLVCSLTHRERLVPLATAITKFMARFGRKAPSQRAHSRASA